MTDIQTPQEGECFYLPGKGVVMVHHPQKDKRLVYGEYEGSLLVSTIHTFEPTPLTPETLDALLPVPSKRQVEDAFHVSHNSEQPHFFPSDFFDKHLKSPNLEDVAKACL